jgi:two-component sensor histidine kinase
MTVQGFDVADQHALAQRESVVLRELQHRAANMIAVVGAVAERTLESSKTLAEFSRRFTARLSALARVNDLLMQADGREALNLKSLIVDELLAHGALDESGRGDQVSLSGDPNVLVPVHIAEALAMVIHELATNALKHGALSSRGGKVDVRWRAELGGLVGELTLEWREVFAASLEPMRAKREQGRRGFGRELIEDVLPEQLGGRIAYCVTANGVWCGIRTPLRVGPAPAPQR